MELQYLRPVNWTRFEQRVRECLEKCADSDPDGDNSMPVVHLKLTPAPKEEKKEEVSLREFVVTHVVDPSSFYVRPRELDEQWHAYERQIADTVRRAGEKLGRPRQLRAGDRVLVSDAGSWHRGKLIEEKTSSSDVWSVFLLDCGRTVAEVPADELKTMPRVLKQRNAFCHLARLAGVVPAAGSPRWTLSAADKFRELIPANEGAVWMRPGGTSVEKDEGGCKLCPMEVFLRRKEAAGAFEPSVTRYDSVADELVDAGLALRTGNAAGRRKSSEEDHQDAPHFPDRKNDEATTKCLIEEAPGQQRSKCPLRPVIPASLLRLHRGRGRGPRNTGKPTF